MAKRKMSKAQKAALAKGRKALAARRHKKTVRKAARKTARKTTKRRKTVSAEHVDTIAPIFINSERKPMKRKSASRKVSHVKKSHRRKSRRYYGIDIQGPMALVKDGVVAAIGGVAGSFIANKVPVQANIKPLLPVVLGAVIGSTKFGKNPMIHAASLGMVVAGALALTRQYVPQVALLAGEDETEYYGIPTMGEEVAALTDETDDENLMGIPTMGTEAFVNSSDI